MVESDEERAARETKVAEVLAGFEARQADILAVPEDAASLDASFFGAAHGAFGRYFWASAGYKLVNDVFIFVNPALINVIVGYINGDASQARSRVDLG